MARYTIKDFSVGDSVYHLSNKSLRMVAIKILPDLNEITCRWVDSKGIKQTAEFMPEELGKTSDLGPRIMSI